MESIITKLSYTQDGTRVNVFLNEEYSFTIHADLIIEYKLTKGIKINDELRNKLIQKDVSFLVLKHILNKVARRQRSKFEIKNDIKKYLLKLKASQKYSNIEFETEQIIDFIITELEQRNLLNDLEFAEQIIEKFKDKKSIQEIIIKLRQKGIDQDLIEKSIQILETHDETDQINHLIDKKYRQLGHKNLTQSEMKQKILEFLLRKGYKYSKINEIVDKFIQNET